MPLDLSLFSDENADSYLGERFSLTTSGSDAWRVIGAARRIAERHSFSGTKTYPRPDHPDERKRRPLEFLLVAILVSLRTTLENEQRAMDAVLDAFDSVDDLYQADQELLERLVRPAGLARARATRIRAALQHVSLKHQRNLASLESLGTIAAREALLSIPGFGPKSADCFLTIGLGLPSMVVDVNVFRVASALFGSSDSRKEFSKPTAVSRLKRRLDTAVGDDALLCQIVHTLFLVYGKREMIREHNPSQCRMKEYCLSCSR
jgi:endonuclease III